jgi:hypothetical protein
MIGFIINGAIFIVLYAAIMLYVKLQSW